MFKIVFALFIALTSLAAPSAFDQKFNELQKDMKIDQVKKLLGAPDLRELKDDKETWHFDQNGGRRVIFQKGKVIEFGADEKALTTTPSPTPGPTPFNLSIGDDCKTDQECKSQNCHFHQCAGLNNCTLPLGKVCARDDQCCSGFCDFQICRKK